MEVKQKLNNLESYKDVQIKDMEAGYQELKRNYDTKCQVSALYGSTLCALNHIPLARDAIKRGSELYMNTLSTQGDE